MQRREASVPRGTHFRAAAVSGADAAAALAAPSRVCCCCSKRLVELPGKCMRGRSGYGRAAAAAAVCVGGDAWSATPGLAVALQVSVRERTDRTPCSDPAAQTISPVLALMIRCCCRDPYRPAGRMYATPAGTYSTSDANEST